MIKTIIGLFALALLLAPLSAQAAGALAIGDCGAYGDAYDFPTVGDARTAALRHCKGACRVVATFRRNCVAFAIDVHNACGAHGYAVGRQLGQTQNTALRQCYRYGGKECVIRSWVCDGRG